MGNASITGVELCDTMQRELQGCRAAAHAGCFVCGGDASLGMGVSFEVTASGQVEGRFACDRRFQGYEGMLHGGIVSTLLDAAMTHCLFARGKSAVTGELTVRFLFPVALDCEAVVRARISDSCPPLHRTESEVIQRGRMVARATAKFVEVKRVRNE
jgi:uncharacterized protein (TIGR00369 family)